MPQSESQLYIRLDTLKVKMDRILGLEGKNG
jgi:hypothetical protein